MSTPRLSCVELELEIILVIGRLPAIHVKVHFDPVICGPIGTRTDKRFDVYGYTVNTAATLKSNGFAMTPQVFRKLRADTRKLFKKHTPPIRYIPLESRHTDP